MNTKEYRLLAYFSRFTDLVPFPDWAMDVTINSLISRQFLKTNILRSSACITDAGRVSLADYCANRKNRRAQSRRYWITTCIAALGLIVAILSLLLQVLQARGIIDLSQFLPR